MEPAKQPSPEHTEAYADAHGDTTGTADCCSRMRKRVKRESASCLVYFLFLLDDDDMMMNVQICRHVYVCVENYLVRVHVCTYKVQCRNRVECSHSREQGAETRDQRAEGRGQRAEGREQRGAESREQRGAESREEMRELGCANVAEKEKRPSLKPSLWCLRRRGGRA